jgi:hypothetical protein
LGKASQDGILNICHQLLLIFSRQVGGDHISCAINLIALSLNVISNSANVVVLAIDVVD